MPCSKCDPRKRECCILVYAPEGRQSPHMRQTCLYAPLQKRASVYIYIYSCGPQSRCSPHVRGKLRYILATLLFREELLSIYIYSCGPQCGRAHTCKRSCATFATLLFREELLSIYIYACGPQSGRAHTCKRSCTTFATLLPLERRASLYIYILMKT